MNNHDMVQLRSDSLDADPEEGKLRDALGVQSPRATGQVKRYQCKKNKCKKIFRYLYSNSSFVLVSGPELRIFQKNKEFQKHFRWSDKSKI